MTTTSASACRSALAASRPPKPAPTITTLTLSFAIGSLRTGANLNLHHWLPSSQRRFSNPPATFLRGTVYGYPQSASSSRRRIGPEVMAEVTRVIDFFNKKGSEKFATEEALVGGCCYDAHKVAIADATMEKAKAAD